MAEKKPLKREGGITKQFGNTDTLPLSNMPTLPNSNIYVGNGSNVATTVPVSGDITLSNTGEMQVSNGVIVNSDINVNAAIDASKIADGSVTNTEFQHINSLTSNAQTQLNNKATKGGDLDAAPLVIGTKDNQPATIITDNTTRLTIDTSGKVGINTNNPLATLHLYGPGANGSGAEIAFGDDNVGVPYASVGERTGDSDKIDVYGQKGVYITTGAKGSASNLNVSNTGAVCIGTETQSGSNKLTVSGTTSINGNLTLTGSTTQTGNVDVTGNETITGFKKYKATTTPASPANGTECNTYFKGGKFIIQYNDGGTVRYKYLDLTGTGTTWVYTTIAP